MGFSVFSYRSAVELACALVIFAALSACDNTVDPFARGDTQPFAIFGYLDSTADTQFVRISRMRSNESLLDELGDPPLVTITDIETGESAAWEDSVIVLDDGTHGRTHLSTFDIRPAATYRLDIADEGVDATQAFTTLPGTNGIINGVPRQDSLGNFVQTVVWQNLRRARDIQVHYRVRALPTGADTTVIRPYGDAGGITADGWLINVALDRDARIVQNLIEFTYGDTTVVLLDVSMLVEALSEEWAVTGEPTNIENGTGFFASVARLSESWSLDSTVTRSLGYQTQ